MRLESAMGSDDKSLALKFEGVVSAPELSTLITDLAVLRSRMLPVVPINPPSRRDSPEDAAEHGNIAKHDADPYLAIRARRGGGARFYFRSSGFGWMAVDISPAAAITIRNFLNEWTADRDTGDFVGGNPDEFIDGGGDY